MQKSVLAAPFFWDLRFAIEKNKFLSRVVRHAIVDKIIKKYRKEKDFEYFFSQELINGTMIDWGKNWKISLKDLDFDPFIF